MSRLGPLLALAVLSSGARATTFVVDAGGTARFFDVQSAINAAQPGDIILVNPGTYAGFTLDKGLVVIGQSSPTITGPIHVTNLPAGLPVALVQLSPRDVFVAGCFGTVLLEDLANVHSLSISQSNDVRAARLDIHGLGLPTQMGHDGIIVANARLELVDSVDRAELGRSAGLGPTPGIGGDGGSGLVAGPSARVHAVRSTIVGGRGGPALSIPLQPGDGGPGLELSSPCEIFLVGSTIGPASQVLGGDAGQALWNPPFCYADGYGSCAIFGSGTVTHSRTTIQGGITNHDINCAPSGEHVEPAFCTPSPSDVPVAPADPGLMLTGTATPGSVVTLNVEGEPGAMVVLRLGQHALVAPTLGTDIEVLTTTRQSLALGPIPANGSMAQQIAISSRLARGFVFYGQADVLGSTGLRRTNSVPLIVR